MRVATVCSNGVGSSLILRISVERALAELGYEAEVFATDLATLSGQPVDLVVTTASIAESIDRGEYPVVVEVINFVDVEEIKSGIRAAMNR